MGGRVGEEVVSLAEGLASVFPHGSADQMTAGYLAQMRVLRLRSKLVIYFVTGLIVRVVGVQRVRC